MRTFLCYLRIILFHLLLLLAAFVLCRWIVGARRRAAEATRPMQRDTIIIRDTIRVSRPVPVREEVVRYVTIRVTDTAAVSKMEKIGKDSAEVTPAPTHSPDTAQPVLTLPITQQVYRDSSYTAWVSGYQPSLDSIEVYPRSVIVREVRNVRQPPRRWSFGLQGGVGMTPKGVQPYVGVGVSVKLF